MKVVPSDSQIDTLHSNLLNRMDEGGSKYPGMTYEEGCLAVLDWLSGNAEDDPYED